MITLDYFVYAGSCQWQTKSDPVVHEEKKDLDRIICDTNQDLTINIKLVHEKKKTLPGLITEWSLCLDIVQKLRNEIDYV